MSSEFSFEDFYAYYPHTPTALAIKECVRLHAMRGLPCPSPILDVGCGDGLFARLAFQNATVWGIDIDGNEGRRAQASKAYSQVVLGDVTTAELPSEHFGSCIANCSLEHVPDLDAAARSILRSLKPGGLFYTFLPSRDWADFMLSPRTLRTLKLEPLASTITETINTVFKHAHLHDAAGWSEVFERQGFQIDKVEPIGSTATTVAFEAFLLPSLVGLLNKRVTGRWTLVPSLRKLSAPMMYAVVRSLVSALPQKAPTAEFLLSARKPS